MDSEKIGTNYDELVKELTPNKSIIKQCFKAFVCGGAICTLGQAINNMYVLFGDFEAEAAATWTSLTLIALSIILTCFNLYGPIVKWGGAGALVPITGFANGVCASAIEYKKEGQVFGTGSKIFTIAGPVILFGVVASIVFGFIYWILI